MESVPFGTDQILSEYLFRQLNKMEIALNLANTNILALQAQVTALQAQVTAQETWG